MIYFLNKIVKIIWPIVFRIRKVIYLFHIRQYERQLKKKYNECKPTTYLTGLIFSIDENFQHGGLVDKMKGIVSAYYLSKIASINFYIFFSDPLNPLINIVNSSVINVITDRKHLSFSNKISSPIIWYNYSPISKKYILRRLKNNIQIHFYCNINILPVFKKDQSEIIFEWSKIYNDIFKKYLTNQINPLYINNKYIGIHLRFIDLFGDFSDLKISHYSNEHKILCLNWCVDKLNDLFNKYKNFNFLIVSDSKYFLDHCKRLPYVSMNKDKFIINSNNIGHIYINKDLDTFKKTVSDFISLSLCYKVFQIRYSGMHNSDFSRYASYVNLSDFILID
jgi:hypothetical protein